MALLVLWVIGGSLLLALYYRRILVAFWREPVLKQTVVIIESDDWGPGPPEHAEALRRLISLLTEHRDSAGHPAVMTLGVVLGVPDSERLKKEGLREYYRIVLDDPAFSGILDAMREGEKAAVFSLQLHGMEHYWPPAVLAAATIDQGVKNWLVTGPCPNSEKLPAHLQSRWIDSSKLPSRPLNAQEVTQAASEEVKAFLAIFGRLPQVVVPPTFIWNPLVERVWVQAGIGIVVTPGVRLGHRDERGRPVPTGPIIVNGENSPTGAVYAVRNGYFEPIRGHTAQRALTLLQKNSRLGRPTLFETHRFNFTGAAHEVARAFAELDALLREALTGYADLLFMSTQALVERQLADDPKIIEQRLCRRVHIWLRRVQEVSRLRKFAWLTGAALLAWLVLYLTRSSTTPRMSPYAEDEISS